MPYRFLPHDVRQWLGFFFFTVAVGIAVWQSLLLKYNAELRAIQEKELRFWSEVSTTMPSAIVAVDAETGKIEGWNPTATDVLGWTPDEVKGHKFTFLVPKEYVNEKYGSIDDYFDIVTDPTRYTHSIKDVKIIPGVYVNTKDGGTVRSRVTIRTIGGAKYIYIVAIDPIKNIEIIEPPIIDKPEEKGEVHLPTATPSSNK